MKHEQRSGTTGTYIKEHEKKKYDGFQETRLKSSEKSATSGIHLLYFAAYIVPSSCEIDY
jgi:hypothetical protein